MATLLTSTPYEAYRLTIRSENRLESHGEGTYRLIVEQNGREVFNVSHRIPDVYGHIWIIDAAERLRSLESDPPPRDYIHTSIFSMGFHPMRDGTLRFRSFLLIGSRKDVADLFEDFFGFSACCSVDDLREFGSRLFEESSAAYDADDAYEGPSKPYDP